MAQLAHADIVRAREGRDGGYRLARSADHITLAEVYQALKAADRLEEAPLLQKKNVSVQPGLDALATEIEQALFAILERHTLASLLEYEARSHPRS
jgi:DNA-binding IscR family transcriptional regulator